MQMRRINTRIVFGGIVVIAVLGFFAQRWLIGARSSAIQLVRLTNVPSVIVGAPKFLEEPRRISFEGVVLPNFLSKEDISEIALQVSRVHTQGDKVSRVEACWEDMLFAVRVRVSKSSVFLVKDSSDSWRVLKVTHMEH